MPQLQRETIGEKERGISDGPIGTVQKNDRDNVNIVENQGSPHTESLIWANEKDMSNIVINTENKNAEVSTNIPQHHELPTVGGRVCSVTAALAGEEEATLLLSIPSLFIMRSVPRSQKNSH
uniref:Uncharacterized protein n=1 Tax=Bracon brevicornis TaxID=1563983 RepID=A0A6V7JJZ5_9HYME